MEKADRRFDPVLEALERDLAACRSDDERLALALPYVLEIAPAERGFVLLRTGGTDRVVATHNLEAETLWTTADVSQTIILRSLEGAAIVSDNAVQDRRFNDSNSVLLSALRAVMSLPIQRPARGGGSRTVGVVYVDNRFQRGAFSQAQLEGVGRLVATLAASLADPAPDEDAQGPRGLRRKF
jgi:GAF domain-containing protein